VQTTPDAVPEPVPIVDGVPSEKEIHTKLSSATDVPRSFEATWQERPSLQRPAMLAWRVTAVLGQRVIIERFDMSAADRFVERYARDATGATRPLSEAPAWIQWLMGANPREIVKRLHLDGSRRALDVVNKRVLWVLGAQANQRDRSQVRIDRETGAFHRIVERRSEGPEGQLLDVSLFERVESGATPWLPGRLSVRQGEKRSTLHLVSSSVIATDRSAEP
jgi:hypothetical protein